MGRKQILTNKEIEKDIINALRNPTAEAEESYKKRRNISIVGGTIVGTILGIFGRIYYDFGVSLLFALTFGVFVYAIFYRITYHITLGTKIKRVSIRDYEINTEVVSHTYWESYVRRRSRYHYELINNCTLHFENGKKWDVPKDNYLWSVEFPMSSLAIYNSSHRGDVFMVVTKKKTREVVMAYNTEFFEYKN